MIVLHDKATKGFNNNIPKVGETYDCFDDGKIRPSRHYEVKVVKVIPWWRASLSLKMKLRKEASECYWLYKKKTDYFVITDNGEGGKEGKGIFTRTLHNGWFSHGFLCAGRLDIDGSLVRVNEEDWVENWRNL